MTTMTLWVLIFTAQYHRPAVVVERFATEAQCRSALATVNQMAQGISGISNQMPICLRVEAAR